MTKVKAKVKPKDEGEPRALVAGGDGIPKKYLTSLVDELVAKTGFDRERGRAELLGGGAAIRLPGVVSTQIASLDAAIGRGGFPLGRVTTIHGGEGGGKTTLLLHGLAEVQRLGGLAVLIERENKLDESLANAIGLGDNLVFSKPPYLERAFDVMERVIKKVRDIRLETGRRVPCLIGVDSVDGFDTKSEILDDGGRDWDGENVAPTPRVMSRNLPRITDMAEKESVGIVFITQMRAKIGVMHGKKTGPTGGKALAFHSVLMLDVTAIGKIKEGDRSIGNRVKVEVVKNQIAAPFRRTEFDLVWGRGVDVHADLLEYGVKLGVIEKEGAYYSHKGERIGAGIRRCSRALAGNPKLLEGVRADILEAENRDGLGVALDEKGS